MSTKSSYDFTSKKLQYRAYSDEALEWSRNDALEAAAACKGHDPVASAWYLDDASTIGSEIARRAAFDGRRGELVGKWIKSMQLSATNAISLTKASNPFPEDAGEAARFAAHFGFKLLQAGR